MSTMRAATIIGSGSAILSLAAMIIGHTGQHSLTWTSNQISTYAALGPNGNWITAALLLAALTLICLSFLISKHHLVGTNQIVDIIPLILGAAVAGLILLASFKETSSSVDASSLAAVRQQATHDAGLLLLFFSLVGLAVIFGWIQIVTALTLNQKIVGLIIVSLAPLSFILLSSSWPTLIGLTGNTFGLQQRSAMFCLWLPIIRLLVLTTIERGQ